jgi:Tol biopolymer transport system component
MNKFCTFLIVLFFVHSFTAFSQFTKETFGKNRMQYEQFDWRFVTTQNFDIYYYEGGYDLAVLTAKYAELDFKTVTDAVGFSPYSRTKVFVYESVADLQQSNVGIKQQGLEVNGQTQFVRSEVEIAFTGTRETYRTKLRASIADILIFEMMYGGNLKELLQSSYLLSLPEWFMGGAAQYISEGWTVEMDNFVRDLLVNTNFKSPDKLTDMEARLVGQSIWNFIAEKYGKSNVANILNLTRIMRNETESIQNTLGIPYDKFIKLWKAFYLQQYEEIKKNHKMVSDSILLLKTKKGLEISQLSVNPNGKYLAFTENMVGKLKVKIYDLDKKSEKTIYTSGYKVVNQQYNKKIPLIAWKGNSEIVVIAPKRGKNFLSIIPVGKVERGKEASKMELTDFTLVNSIDISSNGSKMVLSGVQKSQSDIFIYNFSNKRVVKVTNDIFDDIDAKYVPNSNNIVFASNRTNDTLAIAQKAKVEDLSNNYNIYSASENDSKVFKRISNTLSFDYNPIPINEEKIVFLSDQRGITHLFGYDMKDGVTHQISNYSNNIENFALSPKSDRIYFVAAKEMEDRILSERFDFTASTFTGKTQRQQIMELRYVQKQREARKKEDKGKKPEELKSEEDNKDSKDDKEGYEFDSISKNKRKKFLEKFKSKLNLNGGLGNAENVKISKSEDYQNNFTLESFTTSVAIDPLRNVFSEGLFGGFGFLLEIDMTDVRENHKVRGGIFSMLDINNSAFFGEYEYLKNRIDLKVRFDKSNFQISENDFSQRYRINSFDMSASYPISIQSRLSLSGTYQNTSYLVTAGDITGFVGALGVSDIVKHYGGFKTEFVYDNSFVTGMNMFVGTKFRVGYEHNFSFDNSQFGFGNITAEVRHYQKLHKSIILAGRLMYGQFTGASKKRYFLGGMDNWFGGDVDNGTQEYISPANIQLPGAANLNDLSDLLFSRFMTSMRGFNYNRLNGTSVLLSNVELRIPLLKYFHNGTVNSNFFRNLQLVGFMDAGSAWSGVSPFKRRNSVNTVPFDFSPPSNDLGFKGEVTNFGSPFLLGYGVGARTMVFGYYTKFDMAWGKDEGGENGPKFYVTLGYDF